MCYQKILKRLMSIVYGRTPFHSHKRALTKLILIHTYIGLWDKRTHTNKKKTTMPFDRTSIVFQNAIYNRKNHNNNNGTRQTTVGERAIHTHTKKKFARWLIRNAKIFMLSNSLFIRLKGFFHLFFNRTCYKTQSNYPYKAVSDRFPRQCSRVVCCFFFKFSLSLPRIVVYCLGHSWHSQCTMRFEEVFSREHFYNGNEEREFRERYNKTVCWLIIHNHKRCSTMRLSFVAGFRCSNSGYSLFWGRFFSLELFSDTQNSNPKSNVAQK